MSPAATLLVPPFAIKPRTRKNSARQASLATVYSAANAIELTPLLDGTLHSLLESAANRDQVRNSLDHLFNQLALLKSGSSPGAWKACLPVCRSHPLISILHEDPFTRRAFAKPRGYAGDAELIDLIYGPKDGSVEPDASPLGLEIYRYTTSAPAAEGVRSRRAFVADLIDDTTCERPGSHILAIAAGHLREANLTTAIRCRRMDRFVALDADPVSLKVIDNDYGAYGIETVPSSFGVLITNRLQIGKFDLVYSTGLFDYLSQSTGRRLVKTMFDMLKPGGELVVANFLPGIRDVGYMEAFMDWTLTYRTRHEMVDLTSEIDESEIHHLALFAEENRNIIFLRVTRKRESGVPSYWNARQKTVRESR